MSRRLIFVMFLAAASGGAYAQSTPTNTGGEGASGTNDGETGTTASRRTVTTADHRNASATARGEPAARTPRWHSFLPGMFR